MNNVQALKMMLKKLKEEGLIEIRSPIVMYRSKDTTKGEKK